MHLNFIPYGDRRLVEILLREMEAQKFPLRMWKGKKEKVQYVSGQIRVMPFGMYEFVFPKESLDTILRTFNIKIFYYGAAKYLPILRKVLKLKKIPKFEEEGQRFLWVKEYITIIPIGIREDKDFTDDVGPSKGWTHEGL